MMSSSSITAARVRFGGGGGNPRPAFGRQVSRACRGPGGADPLLGPFPRKPPDLWATMCLPVRMPGSRPSTDSLRSHHVPEGQTPGVPVLGGPRGVKFIATKGRGLPGWGGGGSCVSWGLGFSLGRWERSEEGGVTPHRSVTVRATARRGLGGTALSGTSQSERETSRSPSFAGL